MATKLLNAAMLALGMTLASGAWADRCTTSTPVAKLDAKGVPDVTCEIPIEDVHLTQTSVGKVAVDCKRLSIDKQVEGMLDGAIPTTEKVTDALNAYLKDDPDRMMPLVIGPNGKFYTTDHHHLGTAIWTYKTERKDYDRSKLRFQAYITTDWHNDPSITMDNFWQRMADTNRAWPYDNNGIRITGHCSREREYGPYPKNFGETRNDKYRTLSRWVRESCLYVKEGNKQCDDIAKELGITPTKADFEELVWANYLREALPWPAGKKDSITKLKQLWKDAPKKATSKKAKKYLDQFPGGHTAYGFNAKREYLKLEFDGGCEEPTDKVKKVD